MPDGHAGSLVAAEVTCVFDIYGIRNPIGNTTTDSATLSNTMCRTLSGGFGLKLVPYGRKIALRRPYRQSPDANIRVRGGQRDSRGTIASS